jgi:sulfur relay (sulfurtransferase) complex TusBCD TusD component (DsrE family)
MGDAVRTGRAAQEPLTAHSSLEGVLRGVREASVPVAVCRTCGKARRLAVGQLVMGARIGTIHELAGLVRRVDRVVSF